MSGLCREAELAPGKPAIARLPGGGSVIVLRLAGGLAAYRNACPHMGIELDWEPARLLSRSGKYLQCTGHGALFELATGACVRGPCLGEALAAVAVRSEGGMVVLDD